MIQNALFPNRYNSKLEKGFLRKKKHSCVYMLQNETTLQKLMHKITQA